VGRERVGRVRGRGLDKPRDQFAGSSLLSVYLTLRCISLPYRRPIPEHSLRKVGIFPDAQNVFFRPRIVPQQTTSRYTRSTPRGVVVLIVVRGLIPIRNTNIDDPRLTV